MGRSKHFHIEDIQKGLCEILKKEGFGGFSMPVVAKELKIPIGSLYHRYSSKVEMVADLWISVIEAFQSDFEKIFLANKDPMLAGKLASAQVAKWMEREPEFAYLLSYVRKEDLSHKEWTQTYKLREKKLKIRMQRIWNEWFLLLFKHKPTVEEIFIAKSVIVDIPLSVCKQYIGNKFPSYVFLFLEETYLTHFSKYSKENVLI